MSGGGGKDGAGPPTPPPRSPADSSHINLVDTLIGVTRSALPPPPLTTSVVGSFAWDTLHRRVPEILVETRRRLGPVPATVDEAFDALAVELRSGQLRGLAEAAPDRAAWDEACAPYVGRSWLDLPWYFAESYFYRRVVEATGYFGAGLLAGRDPYAASKATEWALEEGPARAGELLATAPEDSFLRLEALILGSLWGNRADLSYNVARELGAFAGEVADLLVNDTALVARFLMDKSPARVALIADNAGTECLMDLALIDHLLGPIGVPYVELHVKNHPFFVSDTIEADLPVALAALAASGRTETVGLGARIGEHLRSRRLVVKAHPFYTSSAFYRALPKDLRAELASFGLVVVKGDANYRRLLSDAPWPPETSFADVVGYFPAPVCALRTMKAPVVVGLRPGQAADVDAADPRWMVNGKRGLVQARLS